MQLSIIIVNYNSGEDLYNCIKSIRDFIHEIKYEIIIIDNNSNDDSLKFIATERNYISIYRLKSNMGYAYANNYGIRKSRANFILLLNPDTFFIDSSIKKMVHFLLNNSEVGVLGPRLISPRGDDNFPPSYFPLLRHQILEAFYLHRMYSNYKKRLIKTKINNSLKLFEVDWVSGACFLFRREIFYQTGGFDDKFYIYSEDVDWCKRIKNKGWKVFSFFDSKIVHIKGSSTHKNYHSLIYNRYRSKHIYCRKHYLYYQFIFLHVWVIIGLTFRILCLPLKDCNIDGEKYARFNGYIDSLLLWIGCKALK